MILVPSISQIIYWDQVNSSKNLWKLWNGPLCRNKSGPSLLLNVAVYWQSSDTETCVKKLSQILANNIDNRERGIGLRIYVRYCWYFNQHTATTSISITSFAPLNLQKKFPNYIRVWSTCKLVLILWIKSKKDLILHSPHPITLILRQETRSCF